MPLDVGRVTHLMDQMHRSEDDAGNPIPAGKVWVTDGSAGGTWEDHGSGSSTPFDHGNMGATETVDLADGDWHRGTLNANCAITVTGFTADEGAVLLFEVTQDGTGGWDITWDADVDFGGADDQPSQTASTTTTFMLWSSAGDTTIYGAKVGGGGAALTVEDEGTPLATAADTLDFVGPLVTASGAGAEKTITVTGALNDLTDVTITAPAEDDQLQFIGSVWVNSARRWEAVTDGEDVFVWDGDDLVHEWETY